MNLFEKRLGNRSGAPSSGVISHRELDALDEAELKAALSLIQQEIQTLLPKQKAAKRDFGSAMFRRRLAQLAMNKRLVEEELGTRPAAAAG